MNVVEGLEGSNIEENEGYSIKGKPAQMETGGLGGIALVGKYKYLGSDNPKKV